MRTLVNGMLTFADREIPVGVASVASRKEVSLKTLHKCGGEISTLSTAAAKSVPAASPPAPVSMKRWCVACGCEAEETVRAYEVSPGQFVVLSQDEVDSLAGDVAKVIRLDHFVPVENPLAEKYYWITPNAVLSEAYWAFHAALLSNGTMGMGVQSLWGKELPCAVTAQKQGLMLHIVFVGAEIAQNDLTPTDVSPAALRAIERLTRPSKGAPILVQDKLSVLIAGKLNGDTVLETLKKSLKETTKKEKVKT